jgi:UDP-2,3-diacylglucosamine pyrophosphatase LpxH
MTKKQELLEEYVKIARKLNKLPSFTELRSFSNISKDKVRHHFGTLSKLQDEALAAHGDLEDSVAPAILAVEDIELYRENLVKKSRNNQNSTLVKNVNTLDFIAKFSEDIFKGRFRPMRAVKSTKKLKRNVHLVLSDHHYGSDIRKEETGFQNYGKVEESRRLAAVIKETIEFKLQHRDETELTIHLLGDMIENKLHDPQDAAPLAEQVCRAIHILTQAIAQCAENFPKVTVKCATGNHGRTLSRHEKRATSAKWDSIETMIYYSIKNSLTNYENVEFDLPKTPFVVTDSLGARIFSTHGDTVLNPGNPGKSINVRSLEHQVNSINATLRDNKEYNVFIVGHIHTASITQLTNGAVVITNGALCPPNGFATSIGILEGVGVQVLFESVPGFPVGDIRFIKVGSKEDQNVELDKIIKPWEKI